MAKVWYLLLMGLRRESCSSLPL